jgi:hypothetical protein
MFYLLVTLWMTRPVVQYARTSVAGFPGDNLYYLWLLDWYHRSLVHLRWPLDVPTLNAPAGWNLAYNEVNFALALGLPGFLFGGAALAYNVRFWLSFVLSGIFTAIWVWRLTRRMTPSAVAGLIFAFTPYRMSHAFGHLDLLGTEWLPLYFLCLTELLRGGSRRWAIGAAVSLAAFACTTEYYLYMSVLLSLPLTLLMLRLRPETLFDRRVWTNVAVGAAIAAPLVLAIIWPYLHLARQGLIVLHTLQNVSGWSASPSDFLLPTPVHWLVGDWVNGHFDRHLWIESTVNVGVVPLALAIAGWWSARRGHDDTRLIARTCFFAAVVAFVLALGTDLHWLGRRVGVPVPIFLRRFTGGDALVPVLLPGYLLFKYLPFYAGMRVWMRWGIYVNLFLAILAGLGFDRLTRGRSRPFAAAAFAIVCVLVLAEFAQKPYPLTAVEGRPVDTWLETQRDRGTLIQLPADELSDGPHIFYTMFHGHPYVGAAFSPFPTPQFIRIEPSLRTFPSPGSMETMKSLGVRWVVIDLARYPPSIRDEAIGLGLVPMTELSGQLVMLLR